MKKIIALPLIFAMSFSVFAADIFSIVPISGNVKKYTCTDYAITSKFGSYFRTPDSKIVYTLNSQGKTIESAEYTVKDVLLNKIQTEYDASGNIISQTATDIDGENSIVSWKTTFTYDAGKLSDVSEYDENNVLISRTIYSYEDSVTDKTDYNAEGALDWKTITRFNENNSISEVNDYSSTGELFERTTYEYSEDGKIESISVYNGFTNKTEKEVVRYSTNGNVSEITTYNNSGDIIKRVAVRYDGFGNVSRLSTYEVAQKFGTTVNELVAMQEFVYEY